MRRKRRTSRKQAILFPAVAQSDTVPTEVKKEIVRALADLLLEALAVESAGEGGGNEPEDQA